MRTEQLAKCSEPLQNLKAMLGTREIGLSPNLYLMYITDHSKAVLPICFSVFACFGVSFCTVFTFCVSR